MRSQDIVRIARQRAGITQQQLAARSGHPRETIARWESGTREPSLATLQAVIAACDLELMTRIAQRDPSLGEQVAEQLELAPAQRLRRLLPRGAGRDVLRALRWLAEARTSTIAIGGMAAVLQGGPQRPAAIHVEFVSEDPFTTEVEMRETGLVPSDTEDRWASSDRRAHWSLPRGGVVVLASDVAGTGDYPDLRRAAQGARVDDKTTVAVAHPRDLLRMADASPREAERARAPGLRALLSEVAARDAA
ncbi:MAG TPA: helix-turn-helix transcriptional regulator [Solirubrobacteraceae bacterium]|nr:helix-turn-helix transcriptional regulator [Solirubrobacteraceae bacterium]